MAITSAGQMKEMQRDAQAFTARMMKHKYQWQVDDLRKAGLNPILAVSQGAPVGGSPMGSAPGVMGEAMGMMETGVTTAKKRREIGMILDQRRNINRDTELKDAQMKLAQVNQEFLNNTMIARMHEQDANTATAQEVQRRARFEADIASTGAASARNLKDYYDSRLGRAAQIFGRGSQDILPGLGAIVGGGFSAKFLAGRSKYWKMIQDKFGKGRRPEDFIR